ncbi:pyridoxamine 5'-phosphate oxidase family protein [Rhodovibrionaceae bacterium A322]
MTAETTPSQTPVSDIAFTPSVKAIQSEMGSRANYQKALERRDWKNEVTEDLAAFLAARNSFYLASVNDDGQPYIQHRGGPQGFLKPLDSKHIAFADFGGNRQYITVGNLTDNAKVSLFLMDYANRQRIKIWGKARVVTGDKDLLAKLETPGYRGKVERALVIEITAWDVNCPQHIPQLVPLQDAREALAYAEQKIQALESEVAALKAAAN